MNNNLNRLHACAYSVKMIKVLRELRSLLLIPQEGISTTGGAASSARTSQQVNCIGKLFEDDENDGIWRRTGLVVRLDTEKIEGYMSPS